jgi:hypothetical protein
MKTLLLIVAITAGTASADTKLIAALIHVESGGNADAIGDGGKAVGVLQIWPIMVRDCNRILKLRRSKLRYTLKDRYSRSRSIEMFKVWSSHYNKGASLEVIARRWNGGPKGDKKAATKKYWEKVKIALASSR